MAEKKEKQYVSDNARLMAEWNWEKNSEIALDPCKLTTGSHKYASWICASHKTKFEQEIRARTKGEENVRNVMMNGEPRLTENDILRGKRYWRKRTPIWLKNG